MKNKFLKLTTLPLVSTIVLTPIIALSNTQCSKDKTETYHLKSAEQTINFLAKHETPLKGSYGHDDMVDYLKDNLKLQNIVNAFVFEIYTYVSNNAEMTLEIHPSENYFTMLFYWNTEDDDTEMEAIYAYYKDNQLTIKHEIYGNNNYFGDSTNAHIDYVQYNNNYNGSIDVGYLDDASKQWQMLILSSYDTKELVLILEE